MRLSLWMVFGVIGCGEGSIDPGGVDVFSVGDSLLDFHVPDSDVAGVASADLGLELARAAEGGMTMLGDDPIESRYVDGDYALLIASGGGNDFAECGCGGGCGGTIDALVSEDGSDGAIPELVDRAVRDGAVVAWVGYMRPMADAEEFADCGPELDELVGRLSAMSAEREAVVFIDGTAIGTGWETELYFEDGYHPSAAGSEALGLAVSAAVREALGL